MRKRERHSTSSLKVRSNDWRMLGDIGHFLKGKGIPKSDLASDGTPCLRYAEIYTTYRDVADELFSFVNEEAAHAALAIEHGDIIFSTSGETADEIGKAVAYIGNEKAVVGGDTVVLRGHNQDPCYLAYSLNADDAVRQKSRMGKGQSVVHIHAPDLAKVELWLPPLSEQRKIAEILRTWDEAIDKLEALRTVKDVRYRALARQFFDPCHPKFHDRPNNWREFELGDVFSERNQSGSNGEKLLSITRSEGVIDREEVGRKDTSTEDKSRYKLLLPGDIGYNTMRMWQGVSGLSSMQGIVSPAYTVVAPDNKHILARYAAHLFKSPRMVFDFQRYSQGLTSDTWNLKYPAFSKIRVYLPPIDLQEKQANLLNELRTEVQLLERQRRAIERQKRGLMQKLLTGEWRMGPQEIPNEVHLCR